MNTNVIDENKMGKFSKNKLATHNFVVARNRLVHTYIAPPYNKSIESISSYSYGRTSVAILY